MEREPLLTAGTVTSLLTAVFVLLISFGFPIDDDKQAAILGIAAVVFPFVAPLLARSKVTPVASPRDDDGRPLQATSAISDSATSD